MEQRSVCGVKWGQGTGETEGEEDPGAMPLWPRRRGGKDRCLMRFSAGRLPLDCWNTRWQRPRCSPVQPRCIY